MGPLTLSRRAVLAGGAALSLPAPVAAAPRQGTRLRTGLDRVLTDQRERITGRRIALLTHDAALAGDGRRGVDALAALPGVTLSALFAPEHGLSGALAAGERVGDRRDAATGLPVYSLYGARRAPDQAQLAGIDLLLIDLQDVGLRCFTYAGTAMAAMEAAARARVPVLLLDRPNPLGGRVVEGPLPDEAFAFQTPVTALPVPYRHGRTLGELTRHLTLGGFGGSIALAPLDGWDRAMGTAIWRPGALPFAPPSPNLRSPAAVLAYAATVLIEGTNLSEGRGTAAPFEQIGAPWLDAPRLARAMSAARLPGVRFASVAFTPDTSKHQGQPCQGLRLSVTDEARYRGFATGVELIIQLRRLHPDQFQFLPGQPPYFDLLTGRSRVRQTIETGSARTEVLATCSAEAERWRMEGTLEALYRR